MTDDTTRAATRAATRAGDVAFIEALARMLREHDLTEIEVERDYGEDDTLSVRVARGYAPPPPPAAPPPVTAPGGAQATPAAPDRPDDNPGAVTSPMVGTAYLSPEPGASAFVAVGDRVKEGQTLMIVEAMKTMNQIPSPWAGTVTRIVIADGAPVEFGAPLMIVE